MSKLLGLLAVAGLALAGYAGAATAGLLPQGLPDLGLANIASTDANANANANAGLGLRCGHASIDDGVLNATGCNVPGLDLGRMLRGGPGSPGGFGGKGGNSGNEGRGFDHRGPPARGHGPGGFGGMGPPDFVVDGASVTGKWVRFTAMPNATGLGAFTSKGPFADEAIFDSMAISPEEQLQGQTAHGAWFARDSSVQALALDVPNALLGLRNTGNATASVVFTVAQGVSVAPLPNGTGFLLTHAGHEAALRGFQNATLSADGQVVTATLPKDGAVLFHLRGYPGEERGERMLLGWLAHHERGEGPHGMDPDGAPEDPGEYGGR